MADKKEFPDAAAEATKCVDFLQNFTVMGVAKYMDQLQEIAGFSRKVLEISLDDIAEFKNDDEFVENIRSNTPRYISFFEDAADDLLPATSIVREDDVFDFLQRQCEHLQSANPNPTTVQMPKRCTRRFEVSLLPMRDDMLRKLREVKATDIGSLLKVKGMVTRISDVKPQIAVVTYVCDYCAAVIFQDVDGTHFTPVTQCGSSKCKDDSKRGKVTMQSRGCKFIKYQELRLQELPDQVPVGHIPRSMTVHCRGDQTRKCGPGDIVSISGIFLTSKVSAFRAMKSGLSADTYIEATSIEKHKQSYKDMELDKDAEDQIRSIARDPDPYTLMANSIAPEIYGHEDVKKALLLQLVSGISKTLPDGMKIRGDCNILLMGDPGTAKSQLLKYLATLAPRGVYTTGKGSSGVGLTAAVVKDNVTGDMVLEGGALVMADRGICCIDEFDKMDESDRTAIHEVMEQQTISIAKAGITTTLNARAAVLAAANPLFGRYNRKKSISENVDLPNSLLSRFDLLFLILDKADIERDLALSKHVLHVHKFLRNPENAFVPVAQATMKQYIAAARELEPTISPELTPHIVEAYVAMRSQDGSMGTTGPVSRKNDQTTMTARQLLSILRLSQALARLRLVQKVTIEDVEEAIRLTHSSKSSLRDEEAAAAATGGSDDATSAIFSSLRDYTCHRGMDSLSFANAEAMILKKGFTVQQLHACIQEYLLLNIISLDGNHSHIIFEDLME